MWVTTVLINFGSVIILDFNCCFVFIYYCAMLGLNSLIFYLVLIVQKSILVYFLKPHFKLKFKLNFIYFYNKSNSFIYFKIILFLHL
jgi:tellurite resistance protein TehA-like permease